MQVQNVSFGARYVKNVSIKKIEPKGLQKHKVAMVELNPHEINDIRCVNELNLDWGGKESLSYHILQNMCNIFTEFSQQCKSRFFILTQQKDNFQDLEAEKVLSIAQTSEIDDSLINLDLIETFFEESHNSKNANFKHIGQGMLDNIKFLNFGKDIFIETHERNEAFYQKNGFEKIEGGINRFIFRSAKY